MRRDKINNHYQIYNTILVISVLYCIFFYIFIIHKEVGREYVDKADKVRGGDIGKMMALVDKVFFLANAEC